MGLQEFGNLIYFERENFCIFLSAFRTTRQIKYRMLIPIPNKKKYYESHNKVTINKSISHLSHLILTITLSVKYYCNLHLS